MLLGICGWGRGSKLREQQALRQEGAWRRPGTERRAEEAERSQVQGALRLGKDYGPRSFPVDQNLAKFKFKHSANEVFKEMNPSPGSFPELLSKGGS